MSWSLFISNVSRRIDNLNSLESIDDVADLYATEYDKAVKRGYDVVNFIPLSVGNVEAMKSLFKIALFMGSNSTSPSFSLITEMGKGVLAYWTGATMSSLPIPIIPAPGSTLNLAVISNNVLSPGTWPPQPPIPPNSDASLMLNQFVAAASIHLTTISGLITTTSLYPMVPAPTPGPGAIPWTGYSIPPAQPSVNQAMAGITAAYGQLDFSNIPLDKNDPDVQELINPDLNKIEQKIRNSGATDDLGKAGATQLNNVKAEILDKALYEQGIISVDNTDTGLRSGYKSLDELLKIAGKWAPKLGKNPRVNYGNLKSGYIKGVHGLCPQGTQAVVVALTGIPQLGTIKGNADWFSFKNPSTGGGKSSFAKEINGKTYYNEKVRVDRSFLTNKSLWQVGDIVVMGYTDGKPYGHIQVWTGWKWVSDFSQNAVQQRKVDFNTIALWRLNANGKEAVESQKVNRT